MKKKALAILLVYLAASLIGVSFAWMTAGDVPETKEATFEWGHGSGHNMTVQERNISFNAYYYDESLDQYLYLGDQSYSVDNLVPSKYASIRLDFTNGGEGIAEVTLQVNDIITDNSLIPYIYFGINKTEGYSSNYYYDDPIGTYIALSEADATQDLGDGSSKCSITIKEDLQITPTTGTDKVSLYMYIMLNKNAPNELQGKDISFGSIRVIFA